MTTPRAPTAFAGEFDLPGLGRVVSGANVVDGLGEEIDRLGAARAVVVTGRTLGDSPVLERVTRPLGDRCRLVFTRSLQHVPSATVADLIREIERHQADCIVSLGGGSPIDTVKAAVYSLLTAGGSGDRPGGAGLVHVAIPTTLSAGEFTSVAGVTDEKTRVKKAVRDPRIAPQTVLTDPTVTLETPAWLWAASGIRALDHAVESSYSIRHHPLSDALAARGLSLLVEHLPRSLETSGGAQLAHRVQCQVAAWMCVFGMTNAGFGLSHAFGHQIGPRWGVAHGVTSCITLPHVMRFMADIAPDRFRPVAEGWGEAFDPMNPRAAAMACADRTAAFIAQFNLPTRLRDVGVPAGEVSDVAGIVHEILAGSSAIDRPVTRNELSALLNHAY